MKPPTAQELERIISNAEEATRYNRTPSVARLIAFAKDRMKPCRWEPYKQGWTDCRGNKRYGIVGDHCPNCGRPVEVDDE